MTRFDGLSLGERSGKLIHVLTGPLLLLALTGLWAYLWVH